MTLKGYAIFKGKLTGGLKNDIRNLVSFYVSSCKPEGTLKGLEGTLKVYGKSLTTVLDEVHFILNLYSFPLPLVPPGKSFLRQGKSFAPLPGRTTSKTPLSFSVNLSFLRISQLPG